MTTIKFDPSNIAADFENDALPSQTELTLQHDNISEKLSKPNLSFEQYSELQLQLARTKLGLKQKEEARQLCYTLIPQLIDKQMWEHAVDAFDAIFLAEQEDAIPALGQGVWLAVTFPIDLQLTIAMLQHIIDETKDNADGAAVAAITALYLVDMRATKEKHENYSFFCNRILASVARRHSNVSTQAEFENWINKLELNNPDAFLTRLRNVIDVLVQDEWLFDRDELRQMIPKDE